MKRGDERRETRDGRRDTEEGRQEMVDGHRIIAAREGKGWRRHFFHQNEPN